MTTKGKATGGRKSIEERLEDMRARLEGLEKRKAEQDRRDRQRLKLRLGTAAVAAGFTADWSDTQLERAMVAAVKLREGGARAHAANKPEMESGKLVASAATTAPRHTAGPLRG